MSNSVVRRAVLVFTGVAAARIRSCPASIIATDLTTDSPGLCDRANVDTDLVNSLGMSRCSGKALVVSDNGPGLSTLYNATGTKSAAGGRTPNLP